MRSIFQANCNPSSFMEILLQLNFLCKNIWIDAPTTLRGKISCVRKTVNSVYFGEQGWCNGESSIIWDQICNLLSSITIYYIHFMITKFNCSNTGFFSLYKQFTDSVLNWFAQKVQGIVQSVSESLSMKWNRRLRGLTMFFLNFGVESQVKSVKLRQLVTFDFLSNSLL